MDYFGIKSLNDLPKPKDFKIPENEVGEAAPIEESIPVLEHGNSEGYGLDYDDDEVLLEEE